MSILSFYKKVKKIRFFFFIFLLLFVGIFSIRTILFRLLRRLCWSNFSILSILHGRVLRLLLASNLFFLWFLLLFWFGLLFLVLSRSNSKKNIFFLMKEMQIWIILVIILIITKKYNILTFSGLYFLLFCFLPIYLQKIKRFEQYLLSEFELFYLRFRHLRYLFLLILCWWETIVLEIP